MASSWPLGEKVLDRMLGGSGSGLPLLGPGRVDALGHESPRASTRVGVPSPHPAVDHVTGPGYHRVQRVIAPHLGVGELGTTLLLWAVGLMDRRVDVDGHRRVAGPRTSGPRSGQHFAGHLVELAGMGQREAPQERPERRRGQHRVAQHCFGGAGPQRVAVIDRVTAGERRMDDRHGLVPDVGMTSRVTKIDVFVEQASQSDAAPGCRVVPTRSSTL